MNILDNFPRLAVLAALLVWGATLALFVLGGQKLTQPGIVVLLALAAATLLTSLAQNDNAPAPNLLLWSSAGFWIGAAYVTPEIVGLLYLGVGALTAGGAWSLERGRGGFSLTGPAAFVAAMLALIFVNTALMR